MVHNNSLCFHIDKLGKYPFRFASAAPPAMSTRHSEKAPRAQGPPPAEVKAGGSAQRADRTVVPIPPRRIESAELGTTSMAWGYTLTIIRSKKISS